jgi:hypothetical protein
MDPSLIQTLVTQIAVPEILNFVRAHHATTGELPTDAEVEAHMQTHADAIVAKAKAFVAQGN